MKVAIVHDYLIRFGGAERVLLNLKQIFKNADIYTLLYDEKKMGKYFPDTKIHTSFAQKFPLALKNHRVLAAVMPSAIESLDLRNYDLVISSSSAFAKGIIIKPKTIHICYCHTPTRFLWDYSHRYDSRFAFLRKILVHYLRIWDKAAANRVDYFIANSQTTANRIKKYYGYDSEIIYPPVNINEDWVGSKNKAGREYFLIVSQLTPHKRIDLAIKAFNKLGVPLIIIGEGRQGRKLRRMACSNIKFFGWQPDDVIEQYYQNCAAFVFPGEDDFGIAPVEAMSFGKPVLAFRKGGATETVIEGVTGEFFDDPAAESLADGVRRIKISYDNYNPLMIRQRAEEFSQEKFNCRIKEFVIKILEQEKR